MLHGCHLLAVLGLQEMQYRAISVTLHTSPPLGVIHWFTQITGCMLPIEAIHSIHSAWASGNVILLQVCTTLTACPGCMS